MCYWACLSKKFTQFVHRSCLYFCGLGFFLISMVTLRELPAANLTDVLLVTKTISRCHNWLQTALWFEQLSVSKWGGRVFWLGSLSVVVAGEGGVSAQQLMPQCAGSSLYLNVLPYKIYVCIQLATSCWMCIWGIVALSLILLPIFTCTNMVAAIKDCWSCCEIIIEVLYSSAGQY